MSSDIMNGSPLDHSQADEIPLVVADYGPWWGRQPDPYACALEYQIGPLEVLMEHRDQEWRVAYRNLPERIGETSWSCTQLPENALPEEDERFKIQRHRLTRDATELLLLPALADRSVVSRPLHPLYIHPGEQLTIYAGTPLWFQARLEPADRLLLDVPVLRPSDTWFGPSTRRGELCYSSRTHARLSLEDLPVRSLRAATPVSIINESEELLVIEKLSLPVTYLSLFSDSDGRLWTESLQVLCERGGEQARVEIEEGPPQGSRKMTLINQPRQAAPASFIQALSELFG